MQNEPKAVRLSRLADEIGYQLGNGIFPEAKLREFRFLWLITPDQEKDGLSVKLKDIEELVKALRRETDTSGSGTKNKLKTIPILHTTNMYNGCTR